MIGRRGVGFLIGVIALSAWFTLIQLPEVRHIEKSTAVRTGETVNERLLSAYRNNALESFDFNRITSSTPQVRQLALLIGRRYAYHSVQSKTGRSLNAKDMSDKSVYDGVRKLKHRYRTEKSTGSIILEPSDEQGKTGFLRIFSPVIEDGRVKGAAVTDVVVSRLGTRWTPLAAGCLIIVFGGILGGLLKRQTIYIYPALLLILFFYLLIYQPARRLDFLGGDPGINVSRISSTSSPEAPPVAGSSRPAETTGSDFESPFPPWMKGVGLLFGFFFYWFFSSGKAVYLYETFKTYRIAYAYIAPAMAGMFVLVLIPLLYGVVLAFLHVRRDGWEFVGLSNFIAILSDFHVSHPDNFYFTFAVTVLWTVSNVVLHVAIGLGLALILNKPALKLKRFYRVLLILPWAIPNYITALIWKGMFHRQFGAVNALLEALGFHAVSWFNHFWTAFLANLMTNVWLGFPFMMVVSLGALQSIPGELYEAAAIDGANKRQQFRHITLPLLKSALFPAIILGTIWTFNMFNIIYLVSGGAPEGATDILIVDAYRWAFQKYNYGYAAAYSLIIFVVLFTYSVITNRITRATEGAFD